MGIKLGHVTLIISDDTSSEVVEAIKVSLSTGQLAITKDLGREITVRLKNHGEK